MWHTLARRCSEQLHWGKGGGYAGLEPSQVQKLKLLQDENACLKKLVADLSLDKTGGLTEAINQVERAYERGVVSAPVREPRG